VKKLIFEGSSVAIVTPFGKDGKIDYESFGKLIDFQIENKTDSIVVCGTTGESATMPDKEHLEAVEFAVKHVAGRVPVIAGAGSNDTYHGTELCAEAAKLGIDGLLLVTPYYNKTTQHGLIKHYETMVSRASDIPVILYNVPGRTGLNIKPSTVFELSKIDNIVGIKEASGDIVQAIEIRKLCGDDFAIYSGNDDIVVPLMSIGAKGVISVLANVMPYETHLMCKNCLEGNFAEASKFQVQAIDLINALFSEVNPVPVKTALNMMGMNVGSLRMPLCDMLESTRENLRQQMIKMGIIKD
jgi:4-hydroxy-tetrahydrodipicolinate synthase